MEFFLKSLRDKFVKLWIKVLTYVQKVSMLLSFLFMIVCFFRIFYFLIVEEDLLRVIVTCIALYSVIHFNKSIQD